MASREVFHFDEFALDVGERRLLRGTETVRLSPRLSGYKSNRISWLPESAKSISESDG